MSGHAHLGAGQTDAGDSAKLHLEADVENRAPLLLEVMQAVCEMWGNERRDVRLLPGGSFNDMFDSRLQETFGYVVRQLAIMQFAYLHLIEPAPQQGEHVCADLSARFFRLLYPGTLISSYDKARANAMLREGLQIWRPLVSCFLPIPICRNALQVTRCSSLPIHRLNPQTYYGDDARGCIDYPMLDQVAA